MDKRTSHYGTFVPEAAFRPAGRFEIHHPPKHGTRLNMAQTGTGLLSRKCLERRIPDRETMTREAGAWVNCRNGTARSADWRFRTKNARIRLKSLYPSIQ